jgi:hypothetical protein
MTKEEYLDSVSKDSGIPKEEIAGVYTDNEKGERLIFKRNQIINQLQKICPTINTSFDKVFEDEFKNISSDLSEILPLIYLGYKDAHKEGNELLITSGDLLRNAANTAISATQTLRCGFRLQSGILLRSIIEICATVVHLITQPEILSSFLNDQTKSTSSISVADKQIPLFGKAWGILSKKQIHINSLHADWYPHREFTDKDEIPAEVTIGLIGVTIMILRITTELAYFKYIDDHLYWQLEDENKVSFIPPQEDKIQWIKEKLEKK